MKILDKSFVFDKFGRLHKVAIKGLRGLENLASKSKWLALFYIRKLIANKKIAVNVGILTIIALTPIISEASVNQNIYTELKKYSEPVDPLKVGELAGKFNPYTPVIDEQPEQIAVSLMQDQNSYTTAQQLSVNANKTFDGVVRSDATYTVLGGETITQIADKFGLHVASILDANGISGVDSKNIKAGTVLTIPSSDTSDSTQWMADIKAADDAAKAKAAAEAKAKLAAAAAAKAKASKLLSANSKSTSSGYDSVDRSGLIVPISGKGISQSFGRSHTGIDYMASIGTSVRAAAGGKVVIISTGWSGGYGNQIVVDHGGGRQTRYAHLSSINVGTGDIVGQGQTIGYSGSTGRSTGPHLHFELIVNGRPVSPF